MNAEDTNGQIVISFPDLSPAEASILAKELMQELTLDAAAAGQITLARANDGAQDLGSILVIAAGSGLGSGLIELAKVAGKEIVKGAFNRAGQKVFDAIWPILRKWGASAKVETPSGDAFILADPAPPRSASDAETLADLKILGVVVLGASTFPYYPPSRKLDNEAFKHSAELAKKVLSPAHTVFRKVEVLDLFDQDLRPDIIVDRIEDHVEKHPDMRDVVLYYCGHGDLLANDERTYYLLLKGTRPGREEPTGLSIKQFRTMIEAKRVLTRRRCIFILDCCFSGEAVGAWQSTSLNSLIEKQIRDVLPSRGVAFLTATDKDLRAWGKGGYAGATMFTGALTEVLTAEASTRRLSLGDLREAIVERIRDADWENAVEPQCYAPRQPDGDISRIPMFVAGRLGLARSGIKFSPQTNAFSARDDGRPSSQVAHSMLQLAAKEWAKIETSQDIADLKLFARHFPGYHSELAFKRIAMLEKEAALKEAQYAQEGRIKIDARIVHGAPNGWFKPGAGLGEWFKDFEAGPEMVVVTAGSFIMGSPAKEEGRQKCEGPQHKVTIARPFAVSRYAVTFDEWDACAVEGGCGGYKPSDQGWGRGRRPVIRVSWNDGKAYVEWLKEKTGKEYRLLSEAEWEYVCRASSPGPFWWGASISADQANYDGNSTLGGGSKGEYRQKTVPVDIFKPNPWGLYQVHGNVWEWVEDSWSPNYKGAPSDGSAWMTEDTRHCGIRGGSWGNGPWDLRSACRSKDGLLSRVGNVGFRVARTLNP